MEYPFSWTGSLFIIKTEKSKGGKPVKIIKRNGTMEVFDLEKIAAAINKAVHSKAIILDADERDKLLTAIQAQLKEKEENEAIGI